MLAGIVLTELLPWKWQIPLKVVLDTPRGYLYLSCLILRDSSGMPVFAGGKIKVLRALMSLSVGWENGPERGRFI